MLDALTDESLSQEIAPGHWTLGRVAWHIVTALPVMLSGTGLKFEGETKIILYQLLRKQLQMGIVK